MRLVLGLWVSQSQEQSRVSEIGRGSQYPSTRIRIRSLFTVDLERDVLDILFGFG
jgi:hypothetical protein